MDGGADDSVPGINPAALATYLPTVLADYDPAARLTARLLAGGRSNLTCVLAQPPDKRWVLRRPPLGRVTPTAHDMAREHRILSLLPDSDFPAPRPRALCTDHSVIGVTFLIYDYVPGRIIADAGPGRATSSIGYLGRQVTRWTDQWQRNQPRELSAFARLASWLTEEVGRLSEDYPATFVHGDYRLDNLVLDPSSFAVRAVLDWEMSTFGDPLTDLALLLACWEQPADILRQHVNVARCLTTWPGFWSRGRILEVYLTATGLPRDHLNACLGLACLKLAAIMEGINYRHRTGQALDDLSAGLADAAPALQEMGLKVAGGKGLAGLAG